MPSQHKHPPIGLRPTPEADSALERKREYDRQYSQRRRDAGLQQAYQRVWRVANPERERARRLRYAEANPARYLLERARNRARTAGLAFDITVADVVVPAYCPVLGIPLARNRGKTAAAGSPTLDRITPELGYVRGNVQVISHRANSMKRDGTLDELVKLGVWAAAQLAGSDHAQSA